MRIRERLDNRDISSLEFRNIMSKKVSIFFERTDIYEKIQEQLNNQHILENFSFEMFKDFIIRINGLMREIPINERGFDGEGNELGMQNTFFNLSLKLPRYADKENLLLQAYEALKKINKDDWKYFIPLMITAIHMFEDGNGRTARTMYCLLNKFDSKQEFISNLEKVLIDRRSLDVNPGLIKREIQTEVFKLITKNISPQLISSIDSLLIGDTSGFDEGLLNFLDICLMDHKIAISSIIKYLDLKGDNILNYIETREVKNDNDEIEYEIGISLKKLNGVLNDNDWKKVIDTYFDLKKIEVEIMIGIFTSSDKNTIKDLLIKRVNKNNLI